MFDNATVRAVASIAARLNVEPAVLLAVAEIESGGKAFARVDGRNEPLIRWECHYFDRRLTPDQRKVARAAKLASPKAQAIPNPAKQEDRWKLLNRAAEINAPAAFESVSWGVGQVMGSHWKALGYSSVTDLVNACRKDVAGQVDVMARFIEVNGLAPALRKLDWAKFARGYNGSGYKANRYDTKMAAAYARWVKQDVQPLPEPVKDHKEAILKLGSDGPFVAELQTRLVLLGYKLEVDGVFGKATEDAVKAFQKDKGLNVDGWAGPRTLDAVGQAIAEKEAAPKIKEAEKTVPPTATKEVKEKFSLWGWIMGIFATGGGGLSAAFSSDWQTVVAVGAVAIVAIVILILMRRQILEAFKAINADAAK